MLFAGVAEEPEILSLPACHLWRVACNHRDGLAAPNSPTPGNSLRTPSRRHMDWVTSQAGVIRDRSKREDERNDEPKHDNGSEPEKENVRTHIVPVYCA